MNKKVVIGSRESKLAVLQSQMVKDYIVCRHPQMDVEILTMKTTGDKILDRTLDKIGGKGLFVKELDRALLEGRSQLSVHSLKDMPMEVPEKLPILAFSKREDVRCSGSFKAYRLFQPSQKAAAERNLPGYAGEKYSWKSSDQTGKAG